MNKIRIQIPDEMKRALYVIAAFVVTTASMFSGMINHASALQVTSRSITASSSKATDIHVKYKVGFTTATTSNIGGIVVDFCSNDPIIGDSCTAPGGFDINKATTTVTSQTNITGFAIDTTNSTANKLIITKTTATSVSTGVGIIYELGDGTTTGFTNPTAVGSYYARIYTYATEAAAQAHNQGTPTGYVDYGGIALSTAAVINITAKVQETLSFCVYKATCGDDPSFTIGHAAGTATIIDSSVLDTATALFSLSTNANGGVAIRMKGDTLKSGANDINAKNPAGAITAGATTEAFGFYASTPGSGILFDNAYGSTTSDYQLINTGGGAGDVTTTYGGQFAHLSAPVSGSVTTLTFGATASNTTPAGTYTATEQIIATGTF
jgi:hypothetical protein